MNGAVDLVSLSPNSLIVNRDFKKTFDPRKRVIITTITAED